MMLIKIITPIILFAFLSTQTLAQSTINEHVAIGVELHDSGEYKKAIKAYEKALKIDPKSTLVNYEIALSYMSMGDHKKAIKYADKVLDQKSDHMLEAYITKGSSLDILGKTNKSNDIFERAIKEGHEHYLLYYNLSLNYYKTENFEKSESNAIGAIRLNSNHASSHLLLANLHYAKENPVQSILASHYFLFLEPNSSRSIEALNLLHDSFNGNVKQDEENENNTFITFNADDGRAFSTIELMLSLMEASKSVEENESKSEEQLFLENTQTFFGMLVESKDDAKENIWYAFYAPFFYNLAESEHMETYIKYITQSSDDSNSKWLEENPAKLSSFDEWLQAQ